MINKLLSEESRAILKIFILFFVEFELINRLLKLLLQTMNSLPPFFVRLLLWLL